MSEELIDAIYELYLAEQRPFSDKALPASLVAGCPIHAYFAITQPLEPSRDSIIVLEIGKAIHERFLKAMQLKGYEIEKLIEVKADDLAIVGFADAVGECKVIELKTVKKLPDKPYNSHLEQVNIYMHGLDIPAGEIVYISRVSGAVKSFRVSASDKLLNHSLEKAKAIAKALELSDPTIIPKKLIPQDSPCFFCAYNSYCHAKR